MNTNLANDLINAVKTGLIDSEILSEQQLRPKLLYNNTFRGNTVLATLENELLSCNSFWFSIAFITQSGLIVLKDILKQLEEKGITGKILTTDYLTFNEPSALRELLKFSNLKIRMYTEENFHTKGYLFESSEKSTLIVGSSNLTQTALKSNKEWNLKITSLEDGELVKETNAEFEEMWSAAVNLTEEWIQEYEVYYKENKKSRKKNKIDRIRTYILKPNKMQIEATEALDELREKGQNKALLISATGTGKTYLSAFDVKNFNPKKLLFLVHRERILTQAVESFKDVLGEGITTGVLSGKQKNINADYLFSTIGMMSKESIYTKFPTDYFEYIIIDETHRAAAEGYQKVMNYFKPQFLLGMTATPERTDGIDIYQYFDHNIAYEIRLQEAMKEKMLCPFHYFGISEMMVDGEIIDDMTEFRNLTSEVRVNHIIEKAEFYGYSGNRVRGLIFCSRREEAQELSQQFNIRGYQTVALVGAASEKEREKAIKRLEQSKREGGLDYIFAVDILNEGIDIPCINQIIMLRPTQSSIIFIQQLGRGLRKFHDKEYLVVIDFIGGYQNNFMIPIALSGDRSYNKDTIRKFLAEGNRVIPGCSTIHFDEIAKKRIYQSIDEANLSEIKLLKEEYLNLKYKLGRIPKMDDFEKFSSIDIIKIIDKVGSYHKFLSKYDRLEYKIELDKREEQIVAFLSQKLARGKRVHELLMLKRILQYCTSPLAALQESLTEEYSIRLTAEEEESTRNNLINQFPKKSDQLKFSHCVFLDDKEGGWAIDKDFLDSLKNNEFKEMVEEIIDFGINRYKKYYSMRYKETNFVLYQKYTYEDVCRLLNWEQNLNAQNIGGYFYDKKTRTMPVFINYIKEEGSIAYEDRFISPSRLIALSKHPRKITSKDAEHIYKAQEQGTKIYLFVRKKKDDKEAKEFYFLGEIYAIGCPNPIKMSDTKDDAFEITYHLDVAVREDIYDYITN